MSEKFLLLTFSAETRKSIKSQAKRNSMIPGGKGLCHCKKRDGWLVDQDYPGFFECGYCRRKRLNAYKGGHEGGFYC